jgi:predicted MFS family arabinose efflux permease
MSQSVSSEETNVPLTRDRNFLTFWTGQALSQVGEQVSGLALPVTAVLLLHASDGEVGVLNAAGVAAFLVIGLPAGAWIDRMRKRSVMIRADLVRAFALAVIPALWWLGLLQIWHLYLVALVLGVATVFFDISYQSIIPSLVPGPRIPDANGKLESTSQLAHLLGPAVAGWLVGVVSAPVAVLTTVGTYLSSFAALRLTRDHEASHDDDRSARGPVRHEVAEGLRWVFGHPLLRRIVATTGISNLASTMTYTLLPILFLRVLGFTPQTMGLVFSLAAVGGLAGALTSGRVMAWLGAARAIPVASIVFSVAALLLPAATLVPREFAFPVLVVEGVLTSWAVLLYNITQVSFRQRITPQRLLGRMNASIRFCVWGVMPLAALAAGALGELVGTVPTIWIGSIVGLASIVPVVWAPFWRMRDLPDPDAVNVPDAANEG